jgi:polysaccharide deacetylase 2 family uncharacterized protein YibQ
MPGDDQRKNTHRSQGPEEPGHKQRTADRDRADPLPAVVRKAGGQAIAILIDDIGYVPGALKRLLAIDAPLAFSVLPYTPHARSSAETIHRAGKEVLLHLPMEPHGYPDRDPGRGALFVSMTAPEIRRTLEKSLALVPHAEGVNNHMGSRFMEQHEPLGVVFDALRERGLYFVDSMTSDASAARPLASERKLRFAPRDLFIDDAEDRSRAAINLKRLLATGNSENGLLLIGHPYPETVTALEEMVPRFRSKGFEIVPLSVMVGRKQGTRQDESLKNSGPDGNGSRKRTP